MGGSNLLQCLVFAFHLRLQRLNLLLLCGESVFQLLDVGCGDGRLGRSRGSISLGWNSARRGLGLSLGRSGPRRQREGGEEQALAEFHRSTVLSLILFILNVLHYPDDEQNFVSPL